MKRASNQLLVRVAKSQDESSPPRTRRRVVQFCAIAISSALALTQLVDVASAAGAETRAAAHARASIEWGEPHAYSGNGHGNGNGGSGNGSKEGNRHGNGSSESNGSRKQNNSKNEANASASNRSSPHNRGASTPKSADDDTRTSTEETTQVAGGGAHAIHEDNGLHLGQLFHQGLNEDQAQALLDAMDDSSGLTIEDMQGMSLGELLRTAHAAGVSTQQVADILESNADEATASAP